LNGGGGWGIFNAILGWQNSATYGSVLSYNLYWLCVIIVFASMRYSEKHGHYPLMKPKSQGEGRAGSDSGSQEEGGVLESSAEKKDEDQTAPASTTVRELTV